MVEPVIIGFGGKAQAGKGTTARVMRDLARNSGVIAAPLAYGWPMKTRTAVLQQFSVEDALSKPPHVREAYQIEGTENGRDKFGENFWVDHLKYQIALLRDEEPDLGLITIVDARFPNELEYIKSIGGFTVYIQSNRTSSGTLTGGAAAHASETSVDAKMFDWVINNNAGTTLQQLADQMTLFWNTMVAPVIEARTA